MILVHNDLTKDPTSRNFVHIEVHTQLHSATLVYPWLDTCSVQSLQDCDSIPDWTRVAYKVYKIVTVSLIGHV